MSSSFPYLSSAQLEEILNSSQGDILQSGGILGCHNWDGDWCYWYLLGRDRNAVKRPVLPGTASPKMSVVTKMESPVAHFLIDYQKEF